MKLYAYSDLKLNCFTLSLDMVGKCSQEFIVAKTTFPNSANKAGNPMVLIIAVALHMENGQSES